MTDVHSPYVLISKFVQDKLNELILSNNAPMVRTKLAKLRKGVSHKPGDNPEIWDITLSDLPEVFLSDNGEPSKYEYAIHIALTLFAMHQQGRNIKTECMHKQTPKDSKAQIYCFGSAVRRLAGTKDSDSFKSIRRRFNATVTSESIEEFSHHLRNMIQLLKAKGIELDYVSLAQEIYLFQFPDNRDKLRLKWGQDFYRITTSTSSNDD